jgi:hypothetical protein
VIAPACSKPYRSSLKIRHDASVVTTTGPASLGQRFAALVRRPPRRRVSAYRFVRTYEESTKNRKTADVPLINANSGVACRESDGPFAKIPAASGANASVECHASTTSAAMPRTISSELSFGMSTAIAVGEFVVHIALEAMLQLLNCDKNFAKVSEPSGHGPWPDSALMWPLSPASMNSEPQAAAVSSATSKAP